MGARFKVHVLDVKEVREMPGAWSADDSRAVLGALEMEAAGLSDGDAHEMAALALQERAEAGEDEAPRVLLDLLLTDDSSAGSRDQTARDFADDTPWEEYPEMGQHLALWRAGYFLQRALPGRFTTPVLGMAELGIEPLDKEASALLSAGPLAVELIARFLAGNGETAVARLFPDEVAGAPFWEAPSLVWGFAEDDVPTEDGEALRRLRVWSSTRWLRDLERLDEFESSAWIDED